MSTWRSQRCHCRHATNPSRSASPSTTRKHARRSPSTCWARVRVQARLLISASAACPCPARRSCSLRKKAWKKWRPSASDDNHRPSIHSVTALDGRVLTILPNRRQTLIEALAIDLQAATQLVVSRRKNRVQGQRLRHIHLGIHLAVEVTQDAHIRHHHIHPTAVEHAVAGDLKGFFAVAWVVCSHGLKLAAEQKARTLEGIDRVTDQVADALDIQVARAQGHCNILVADIHIRIKNRPTAALVGGGNNIDMALAQHQVQALHRRVVRHRLQPAAPRGSHHDVVLKATGLTLEDIRRFVRTKAYAQGLRRDAQTARQQTTDPQPLHSDTQVGPEPSIAGYGMTLHCSIAEIDYSESDIRHASAAFSARLKA